MCDQTVGKEAIVVVSECAVVAIAREGAVGCGRRDWDCAQAVVRE
jgi:hypothetical protein